jgi:hypothetical protein
MKRTRTPASAKREPGGSSSRPGTPPPSGLAHKTSSKSGPAASKASIAAQKAVSPPAPEIPAVLLEGDVPSTTSITGGPGEKYALGPTPPSQQFDRVAELPSAYGTKRLFLTARDPHWLYAQWDFTPDQQSHYNRLSLDKHLVLRIHAEATGGRIESEIHVHPESRHWFAHVTRADAKYTAELGYYGIRRNDRVWTSVATSAATLTPPDTISGDTTVEFATIPVEVPFEKLAEVVRKSAHKSLPLARALEELRKGGHPELPSRAAVQTSSWTAEQERALAEIICVDNIRRVWIGSLEITELVRRQLEHAISSQESAQFGLPGLPGDLVTSVSSPFGGLPGQKEFWFNINAELIVYGATEPDATVTIGGRQIKLRADGSFSYRFALPDGRYEMTVVAVSADETDGRAAELRFIRETVFLGDVGAHPQDPSLKPPTPENV